MKINQKNKNIYKKPSFKKSLLFAKFKSYRKIDEESLLLADNHWLDAY